MLGRLAVVAVFAGGVLVAVKIARWWVGRYFDRRPLTLDDQLAQPSTICKACGASFKWGGGGDPRLCGNCDVEGPPPT